MKQSEKINELAAALCKAQSEMRTAKKDSNSHHGTYADLTEVIECIKGPLNANGLSYTQFPISNESGAGVETMLMHSSGQWISQGFIIAAVKQTPQEMGKLISYAKRYSLQAMAGLPSEDDDGHSAEVAANGGKGSNVAPQPWNQHPPHNQQPPAQGAWNGYQPQ